MQKFKQPIPSKQGFTLVELMVVMAIIAILMGIVIGISGGVTRGAAENQARAQIANLMLEMDKFHSDKGRYPEDWNDFRDWYLQEAYEDTAYTITDGTMRMGENFRPLDPWGREYDYQIQENNPRVYLLISFGPSGASNPDDNISNRNSVL